MMATTMEDDQDDDDDDCDAGDGYGDISTCAHGNGMSFIYCSLGMKLPVK